MAESPNFIVVLADDLAIWALGCYGNPEIRTPHIDELAADGVRLTDFYCTSPVCSPARASLLTGKMPSQHGVQDWIRRGNGGPGDESIGYLDGHRAYTEVLSENGYVCGLSGKWHLGDSPRAQKGNSHWFAHPGGGGRYHDAPMYRDGEFVETEGYLTDVITDDAISFLRAHGTGEAPFHLSVNFTAPHSPWVDQHPADIVDSYADCAFESCPQEPRHPWIKSHPIELDYSELNASPERGVPTVREQLQGYFAAVTALDQCVGRLRREVRELGIEDDTLFIFTSDNGFNCGQHGIWGKGNATFPANMYDSSVKVPLIAAMPSRIGRGGVVESLLSGYDFMPTILEMAGLAHETPEGLPGRSFAPQLVGEAASPDHPVVVYDEFGPTRMIRDRRWKYVHRYPYGPHELYDLEADPGERINLLEDRRMLDRAEQDRADRADTMLAALERWFAVFADPQLDGRSQAVTGRGQLARVGEPGVRAFHGLEAAKEMNDASLVAPKARP
jgi:arylsulfatase A-like enzyme